MPDPIDIILTDRDADELCADYQDQLVKVAAATAAQSAVLNAARKLAATPKDAALTTAHKAAADEATRRQGVAQPTITGLLAKLEAHVAKAGHQHHGGLRLDLARGRIVLTPVVEEVRDATR